MADDLSAALEPIRERQRIYANAPALADESLSSWLVTRQKLCAEDVPRLLGVADIVMQLHCEDRLYLSASDEDHPDACPHDPDSDWDQHFESDDGVWFCTDRPAGSECRCGAAWPCAEYEAVLEWLTRKEKTGG